MVLRPYNNLNIGIIVLLTLILVVGGPYLLSHITSVNHNVIANGLLADMLVTFPAVYYFLIIRPLKLRVWNLLLVITCCCGVAYLILPPQQQQYVIQVRKLSVLAELGVFIYALSKINKIRAEYRRLQAKLPDTAHNLQQSITTVLGNQLAIRMLASELTVLRFGLLCWRKVVIIPPGARRFSTHRNSGYVALFSVMLFVMLVEVFAIHLLLAHYSTLAAVIVSAISVYGIIFLVADLSAVIKSPVLIIKDQLLLRTGMRWRLLTSPDNIEAIIKLKSDFESDESCFKGAIIKSSANVHVKFKDPVTVSRLYRSPILITNLMMSIDKPEAFIAALPVT